ncbi:pimeloyl-ACP methyl ester carboxylesterase [Algoriphagus sp. 4150]|uniref:alpha/beta fold hydrolase n=1 Tax=Algoriphagus sp. 4150 TaxID=2817756 RepID=UPI002854F31F|nr:alpha/beta hydrolase [Algoriphagus sp. 4150]MDR7131448.1 pimeloyl-ACP methyl ester carboxylesterase [Algoriphagus sp. 4150]
MDHNIGIVFIHGAGLNASIWADLIKEINIPTLTIDFPNKKTNSKAIDMMTFDDYVSAAVNQIKNWKVEHFIIVAHSIGAFVGLKVANQFKTELRGFVAVGSIIPINGNSFVSSLPFPQKLIMPVILRLFGTKPPQKSIESELCNDLTAEQTSKIVNEFTPESKALYLTKINFILPDTNRIYIKLENDNSTPSTLQDKMAQNLNAEKIISIDSGHLPMISKAKQLGGILSDFVNEIEQSEITR